jgi:hypothetical protein
MSVRMHKPLVALNLPGSLPTLIEVMDAMVQRMEGNAWFPDPNPSLATVASAITELREAQVTKETRTRGTAMARNEKLATALGLLTRLKGYVQGVANDNPENAAAIIESAGMSVKKSTAYARPPFSVKQGPTSGSARLMARSAGDRGSHHWQHSTDGGRTWRSAPQTQQGKAVISGFVPGQTAWFRHRPVTIHGEGDWSEPIAIIVT